MNRRPYWITFANGKGASAYVETEAEARALAEAHSKSPIVSVGLTGYPARPRLDDKDGWDHTAGECPSFCYRPKSCLSLTGAAGCSNPNGRSCTS